MYFSLGMKTVFLICEVTHLVTQFPAPILKIPRGILTPSGKAPCQKKLSFPFSNSPLRIVNTALEGANNVYDLTLKFSKSYKLMFVARATIRKLPV